MADRQRELIPDDRSLIGKGALAVGFGAKGRNFEEASISRGTKLSGRCVQLQKVRKVARSQIIDSFETEKGKFVLDAFFNWEPMKRIKKGSDMSRFGRFEDQSNSIVLNFLKAGDKVFGTASQKRVAVIESRQNKGTDEGYCGVFREVLTNRADAAKFKIAGSTDRGDMLMKGQSLIKGNTKVADGAGQRNIAAIK